MKQSPKNNKPTKGSENKKGSSSAVAAGGKAVDPQEKTSDGRYRYKQPGSLKYKASTRDFYQHQNEAMEQISDFDRRLFEDNDRFESNIFGSGRHSEYEAFDSRMNTIKSNIELKNGFTGTYKDNMEAMAANESSVWRLTKAAIRLPFGAVSKSFKQADLLARHIVDKAMYGDISRKTTFSNLGIWALPALPYAVIGDIIKSDVLGHKDELIAPGDRSTKMLGTFLSEQIDKGADYVLPQYQRKEYNEAKTLFEKASFSEFWANDVRDGFEFALSSYLTGGAPQAMMGVKGAGAMKAALAQGKKLFEQGKITKAALAARNAKIIKQNTLKTLTSFGAGVTYSTLTEALSEADEVKHSVYQKLLKKTNPGTGKPFTKEEALTRAEIAADQVYTGNLGLLMATNAFSLKTMLYPKAFKRASETFNREINKYILTGELDYAKKNIWKRMGSAASDAAKSIVSEGLVEENYQLAVSRYAEDYALGNIRRSDAEGFESMLGISNRWRGYLGLSLDHASAFVRGISGERLSEKDMEAATSILLGGIIGTGQAAGGIYASYKSDVTTEGNILEAAQEAIKNLEGSNRLYADNLTSLFQIETDSEGNKKIKLDENGNPVYDPKAVEQLMLQETGNKKILEDLRSATITKDENHHEVIRRVALSRLVHQLKSMEADGMQLDNGMEAGNEKGFAKAVFERNLGEIREQLSAMGYELSESDIQEVHEMMDDWDAVFSSKSGGISFKGTDFGGSATTKQKYEFDRMFRKMTFLHMSRARGYKALMDKAEKEGNDDLRADAAVMYAEATQAVTDLKKDPSKYAQIWYEQMHGDQKYTEEIGKILFKLMSTQDDKEIEELNAQLQVARTKLKEYQAIHGIFGEEADGEHFFTKGQSVASDLLLLMNEKNRKKVKPGIKHDKYRRLGQAVLDAQKSDEATAELTEVLDEDYMPTVEEMDRQDEVDRQEAQQPREGAQEVSAQEQQNLETLNQEEVSVEQQAQPENQATVQEETAEKDATSNLKQSILHLDKIIQVLKKFLGIKVIDRTFLSWAEKTAYELYNKHVKDYTELASKKAELEATKKDYERRIAESESTFSDSQIESFQSIVNFITNELNSDAAYSLLQDMEDMMLNNVAYVKNYDLILRVLSGVRDSGSIEEFAKLNNYVKEQGIEGKDGVSALETLIQSLQAQVDLEQSAKDYQGYLVVLNEQIQEIDGILNMYDSKKEQIQTLFSRIKQESQDKEEVLQAGKTRHRYLDGVIEDIYNEDLHEMFMLEHEQIVEMLANRAEAKPEAFNDMRQVLEALAEVQDKLAYSEHIGKELGKLLNKLKSKLEDREDDIVRQDIKAVKALTPIFEAVIRPFNKRKKEKLKEQIKELERKYNKEKKIYNALQEQLTKLEELRTLAQENEGKRDAKQQQVAEAMAKRDLGSIGLQLDSKGKVKVVNDAIYGLVAQVLGPKLVVEMLDEAKSILEYGIIANIIIQKFKDTADSESKSKLLTKVKNTQKDFIKNVMAKRLPWLFNSAAFSFYAKSPERVFGKNIHYKLKAELDKLYENNPQDNPLFIYNEDKDIDKFREGLQRSELTDEQKAEAILLIDLHQQYLGLYDLQTKLESKYDYAQQFKAEDAILKAIAEDNEDKTKRIVPTAEQLIAIRQIVMFLQNESKGKLSPNGMSAYLRGIPGTGKTKVVMYWAIKALGYTGSEIYSLSHDEGSSKNIAESTGSQQGSLEDLLKADLSEKKIIVVDEIGFFNQAQSNSIDDAVRAENKKRQETGQAPLRIIYLGDPSQITQSVIPSIEQIGFVPNMSVTNPITMSYRSNVPAISGLFNIFQRNPNKISNQVVASNVPSGQAYNSSNPAIGVQAVASRSSLIGAVASMEKSGRSKVIIVNTQQEVELYKQDTKVQELMSKKDAQGNPLLVVKTYDEVQGQTYQEVYIDLDPNGNNLRGGKFASSLEYNQAMYTAISRASDFVVINDPTFKNYTDSKLQNNAEKAGQEVAEAYDNYTEKHEREKELINKYLVSEGEEIETNGNSTTSSSGTATSTQSNGNTTETEDTNETPNTEETQESEEQNTPVAEQEEKKEEPKTEDKATEEEDTQKQEEKLPEEKEDSPRVINITNPESEIIQNTSNPETGELDGPLMTPEGSPVFIARVKMGYSSDSPIQTVYVAQVKSGDKFINKFKIIGIVSNEDRNTPFFKAYVGEKEQTDKFLIYSAGEIKGVKFEEGPNGELRPTVTPGGAVLTKATIKEARPLKFVYGEEPKSLGFISHLKNTFDSLFRILSPKALKTIRIRIFTEKDLKAMKSQIGGFVPRVGVPYFVIDVPNNQGQGNRSFYVRLTPRKLKASDLTQGGRLESLGKLRDVLNDMKGKMENPDINLGNPTFVFLLNKFKNNFVKSENGQPKFSHSSFTYEEYLERAKAKDPLLEGSEPISENDFNTLLEASSEIIPLLYRYQLKEVYYTEEQVKEETAKDPNAQFVTRKEAGFGSREDSYLRLEEGTPGVKSGEDTAKYERADTLVAAKGPAQIDLNDVARAHTGGDVFPYRVVKGGIPVAKSMLQTKGNYGFYYTQLKSIVLQLSKGSSEVTEEEVKATLAQQKDNELQLLEALFVGLTVENKVKQFISENKKEPNEAELARIQEEANLEVQEMKAKHSSEPVTLDTLNSIFGEEAFDENGDSKVNEDGGYLSFPLGINTITKKDGSTKVDGVNQLGEDLNDENSVKLEGMMGSRLSKVERTKVELEVEGSSKAEDKMYDELVKAEKVGPSTKEVTKEEPVVAKEAPKEVPVKEVKEEPVVETKEEKAPEISDRKKAELYLKSTDHYNVGPNAIPVAYINAPLSKTDPIIYAQQVTEQPNAMTLYAVYRAENGRLVVRHYGTQFGKRFSQDERNFSGSHSQMYFVIGDMKKTEEAYSFNQVIYLEDTVIEKKGQGYIISSYGKVSTTALLTDEASLVKAYNTENGINNSEKVATVDAAEKKQADYKDVREYVKAVLGGSISYEKALDQVKKFFNAEQVREFEVLYNQVTTENLVTTIEEQKEESKEEKQKAEKLEETKKEIEEEGSLSIDEITEHYNELVSNNLSDKALDSDFKTNPLSKSIQDNILNRLQAHAEAKAKEAEALQKATEIEVAQEEAVAEEIESDEDFDISKVTILNQFTDEEGDTYIYYKNPSTGKTGFASGMDLGEGEMFYQDISKEEYDEAAIENDRSRRKLDLKESKQFNLGRSLSEEQALKLASKLLPGFNINPRQSFFARIRTSLLGAPSKKDVVIKFVTQDILDQMSMPGENLMGLYENGVVYVVKEYNPETGQYEVKEGTVRHEIFHRVFNRHLTAKERYKLSLSAQRHAEKAGRGEEYLAMSTIEKEEYMAELYQVYTDGNLDNSIKGRLARFFRNLGYILGFIKENKTELDTLFRMISDGRFKKSTEITLENILSRRTLMDIEKNFGNIENLKEMILDIKSMFNQILNDEDRAYALSDVYQIMLSKVQSYGAQYAADLAMIGELEQQLEVMAVELKELTIGFKKAPKAERAKLAKQLGAKKLEAKRLANRIKNAREKGNYYEYFQRPNSVKILMDWLFPNYNFKKGQQHLSYGEIQIEDSFETVEDMAIQIMQNYNLNEHIIDKAMVNQEDKVSAAVKLFLSSVAFINKDGKEVYLSSRAAFVRMMDLMEGLTFENFMEQFQEAALISAGAKSIEDGPFKQGAVRGLFDKIRKLYELASSDYTVINDEIISFPSHSTFWDTETFVTTKNCSVELNLSDYNVTSLSDLSTSQLVQLQKEGKIRVFTKNQVLANVKQLPQWRDVKSVKLSTDDFVKYVSSLALVDDFGESAISVGRQLFKKEQARNTLAELGSHFGSMREKNIRIAEIDNDFGKPTIKYIYANGGLSAKTSLRGTIEQSIESLFNDIIEKQGFENEVSGTGEKATMNSAQAKAFKFFNLNIYPEIKELLKSSQYEKHSLGIKKLLEALGLPELARESFPRGVKTRQVARDLEYFFSSHMKDFGRAYKLKISEDATQEDIDTTSGFGVESFDVILAEQGSVFDRLVEIIEFNNQWSRATSMRNADGNSVFVKAPSTQADDILNALSRMARSAVYASGKRIGGITKKALPEFLRTSLMQSNPFISGINSIFQLNDHDGFKNLKSRTSISYSRENKSDWFSRNFNAGFLAVLRASVKGSPRYDQSMYTISNRPNIRHANIKVLNTEEIKQSLKAYLDQLSKKPYGLIGIVKSYDPRKHVNFEIFKEAASRLGLENDVEDIDYLSSISSNEKLSDKFVNTMYDILFEKSMEMAKEMAESEFRPTADANYAMSKLSPEYIDPRAQYYFLAESFLRKNGQTPSHSDIMHQAEIMLSEYNERNKLTEEEIQKLEAENKFNGMFPVDPRDPKGMQVNDKVKGEYVLTPHNFAPSVSVFFMNHYVNSYFLNQLVTGDSNFFKHSLDQVKRMSGVFAPGLKGVVHATLGMRPKFRTAVVTDVAEDQQYLGGFLSRVLFGEKYEVLQASAKKRDAGKEELTEQEVEHAKVYDEIQGLLLDFGSDFELTDAQGFITERRARDIAKGFGEAYGAGIVFKGAHYENTVREVNGELVTVPFMVKYSTVVLTQEMAEKYPNTLGRLKEKMENHPSGPIDEMIFASANKVGQPSNKSNGGALLTADGQFLEDSIIELSNENFRLQSNPDHLSGDHGKGVANPTQLGYFLNVMKELITDGFDGASIVYQEVANLIIDGQEEFYKQLQNPANLSRFIKSLLTGKGNERSLQLVEEGVDFNAPHIVNKIYTQLAAKLSDLTVKIRFAGNKLTLQSSYGIEISGREIPGIESSIDPRDLQFYTDPQGFLVAEVIVPKDSIPNGYQERLISGEEMFMFADGMGFRIPSTELHSAVALKIVGTYDSRGSSMVVAPKELVPLHGSDFDVDSLFMIVREHKNWNEGQQQLLSNSLGIEVGSGQPVGYVMNSSGKFEIKPAQASKINSKIEEKTSKLEESTIVLANLIKKLKSTEDKSIQDETKDKIKEAKDGIKKLKGQIKTLKTYKNALQKNIIVETYLKAITHPENRGRMLSPITMEKFSGGKNKQGKYPSNTVFGMLQDLQIKKAMRKAGVSTVDQLTDKQYNDALQVQQVVDMSDPRGNYEVYKSNMEGLSLTGVFANSIKALAYMISSSFEARTVDQAKLLVYEQAAEDLTKEFHIEGAKIAELNPESKSVWEATYGKSSLSDLSNSKEALVPSGFENSFPSLAKLIKSYVRKHDALMARIEELEALNDDVNTEEEQSSRPFLSDSSGTTLIRPVKFNGKEYNQLQEKSEDGMSVWELMDSLVNAAIDNVKEQILPAINANGLTANVYSALIGLGVNIDTIVRFATQPVIKSIQIVGSRSGSVDIQLNKLVDAAYKNSEVRSLISAVDIAESTGMSEEVMQELQEALGDDEDGKDTSALLGAQMSEKDVFAKQLFKYLTENLELTDELLDEGIIEGDIPTSEKSSNSLLRDIKVLLELKNAMVIGEDLSKLSKALNIIRSAPAFKHDFDESEKAWGGIFEAIPNEDGTVDFTFKVNKFAFMINNFMEVNPHVKAAYEAIIYKFKQTVSSMFAQYHPVLEKYLGKAEGKMKMRLDNKKSKSKTKYTSEFVRFIFTGIEELQTSEILDAVYEYTDWRGESMSKHGQEGWSQNFLNKMILLKKDERFANNRFVQSLDVRTNKYTKQKYVKFSAGSNLEFHDSLELEDDFKQLAAYEIEDGKVVEKEDLSQEFSKLQKDFVTYAIINFGMQFSSVNFSTVLPGKLIKPYVDKAVKLLRSYSREVSEDSLNPEAFETGIPSEKTWIGNKFLDYFNVQLALNYADRLPFISQKPIKKPLKILNLDKQEITVERSAGYDAATEQQYDLMYMGKPSSMPKFIKRTNYNTGSDVVYMRLEEPLGDPLKVQLDETQDVPGGKLFGYVKVGYARKNVSYDFPANISESGFDADEAYTSGYVHVGVRDINDLSDIIIPDRLYDPNIDMTDVAFVVYQRGDISRKSARLVMPRKIHSIRAVNNTHMEIRAELEGAGKLSDIKEMQVFESGVFESQEVSAKDKVELKGALKGLYELISSKGVKALKVSDILQVLKNAPDLGHYGHLIEVFEKQLEQVGDLNIEFKTKGKKNVGGLYVVGKKIEVNLNSLNNNPSLFLEVLVHEMGHAISEAYLSKDSEKHLNKEQKEAKVQLESIYEKFKKFIEKHPTYSKDKALLYAVSNIDEFFVGATSNSKIISILKALKPQDLELEPTKASVFAKVLEAVLKLIGVSNKGSVLSEIYANSLLLIGDGRLNIAKNEGYKDLRSAADIKAYNEFRAEMSKIEEEKVKNDSKKRTVKNVVLNIINAAKSLIVPLDENGNQKDYYQDTNDKTKAYRRVSDSVTGFMSKITKMTNKTASATNWVDQKVEKAFEGTEPGEIIYIQGAERTKEDYRAYLENNAAKGISKGNIIHKMIEIFSYNEHSRSNLKTLQKELHDLMTSSPFKNAHTLFSWMTRDLYAQILERINCNALDPDLAPDKKDIIFSEVIIKSDTLNYAGTVDHMSQNADGSISLADWKTGTSLTNGYNGRLFKYGDTFQLVYDNPMNKAQLQLMFYAFMMKVENPEATFRDLNVVHVPDEYTAGSVGSVYAVQVESMLSIIESYYKYEQPEVYQEILKKSPNAFKKESYNGKTSNTVHKVLDSNNSIFTKLEQVKEEIKIITQTARLNNNKLSQSEEERLKVLTTLYFDLAHQGGIDVKSNSQDLTHMDMLLSRTQIDHPLVKMWNKEFDASMSEYRNEFDRRARIFKALMKPIYKEYLENKSGISATIDKILPGIFKGLINGVNYKELYSFMYKLEDVKGAKIYRILTEEDPEFKNLSEDKQKLITFVNDEFGKFFDPKKGFLNSTAVRKGSKNYSNLELYNNERKKNGGEVFEYYRGFLPIAPPTIEDIESNSSVFRKAKTFMLRKLRESLTMFYENNYESQQNNVEALPIRYLGSRKLRAEHAHTFNMEVIFDRYMRSMLMKKHGDRVYGIGKALQLFTKDQAHDSKRTEDWLDKIQSMLLRNISETEVNLRRKGFRGIQTKGGKETKISLVKLAQLARKMVSSSAMWLNVVGGSANGMAVYIASLTRAASASFADIIDRKLFKGQGIRQEEIGFTLKNMGLSTVKGAAEFFIDAGLKGTIHESKIFMLMKKANYLTSLSNFYSDKREMMTLRNKLLEEDIMYLFYSLPEEINSAIVFEAQLRSIKFDGSHGPEWAGKSMWDAYQKVEKVDEATGAKYFDVEYVGPKLGYYVNDQGQVVERNGLTEQEYARIRYNYTELQGAYRSDEKTAMDYTLIGQAVFQFKRVMPTFIYNGFQAKTSKTEMGRFVPVMQGDEILTKDGQTVYQWVEGISHGRWVIIGKVLANWIGTMSKVAGGKPENITAPTVLDLISRMSNQDYDWKNLSGRDKVNLVNGAIAVTLMFTSLFAFLDGEDDDEVDKAWNIMGRIVTNNATQQYNMIEMAKNTSQFSNPASFSHAYKTMDAFNKFAFTMLVYADTPGLGGSDEAFTRDGNLRGMDEVLKYTPFVNVIYKNLKKAVKLGILPEEEDERIITFKSMGAKY